MIGGDDNQGMTVFLSEIHPFPDGTIKIDHFHNNPLIFFTNMICFESIK